MCFRANHSYRTFSQELIWSFFFSLQTPTCSSSSQRIFKNISNYQKICIILHDEIYVKKQQLFHGGNIYGNAVDSPEGEKKLASTCLGIMIVCLLGGPRFISKMLPIANLKSTFLQDNISKTQNALKALKVNCKVIISDK